MSKVIPSQRSSSGYGYATSKEQFIDDLLEKWKFFPPSKPLVLDIQRLSESLTDGYLDDEYRRNREAASAAGYDDHDEDARTLEAKVAKKKNGFQLLFKQVAAALGVEGRQDVESSSDDDITRHQSFITERIYNHMAMLARTPGTLYGEPYSIREELTERLAGKIGLGLYKSLPIENDLRKEAESVMLRLAAEYQEWLIEKTQQEPLQTTWGYICVFGQPMREEVRATHPLILIADVARAKFAT